MSTALARMRGALRADGTDPARTRSLLFWAERFIKHSGAESLERLGRRDVERFLEHLSRERYAGRPTRSRVLQAIRTLFHSANGSIPPWLRLMLEEERPAGVPNILSHDEIRRLFGRLLGSDWLAAALVYGTGIRLIECVRLRVRDLDLAEQRIHIRDGEGRLQREAGLPDAVVDVLQTHLETLRARHIAAVSEGRGTVTLPPAIAREQPGLARKWAWQYLFPESTDEKSGAAEHHVNSARIHRHFERAAQEAGIHRRVTGHVLRNSYAIHLIQQGVPVRRVEQLLGTAPDDLPACSQDAPPECLELPMDGPPTGLGIH